MFVECGSSHLTIYIDLPHLIVASNQLLMMYPNHQILIPIRSKVLLSVIEISLYKNGNRYVSHSHQMLIKMNY